MSAGTPTSSDDRAAPGDADGLRIGRIGGVPVFLKPSWFVVAAVVTVVFEPTVRAFVPGAGAFGYLVAFGFALLLLLSVFVHELAHAGAAALTGTPATRIVLDLWGGHTAFSEESGGPWRSLAVAAVGPLSNAALALAAEVALVASAADGVPGLLLAATVRANIVVALFNALPGLPLDGGRVLEALVWRLTGSRVRGTLAAGWAGRLVALGVATLVLLALAGGTFPVFSAVWLLLIAALLWQGAGGALAVARWQQRSERLTAQALLRPAVTVPSTATVAAAIEAADGAGAEEVVVLDVLGRPAGVVDRAAAAGVPTARLDEVTAAAVAQSLGAAPVVDADLPGPELLRRMQDTPATRYAVTGPDGAVIGVLDWDDVARFVGRG